jgi:hypothetical protein
VVAATVKGYGNALLGGIAAARGRFVVMGGSDDSYNFGHIPRFREELRKGSDLVMGTASGKESSLRPCRSLIAYFGNPGLTALGRVFWQPMRDFYCGIRGFSKAAYERLDLRTTGMEFAHRYGGEIHPSQPEDCGSPDHAFTGRP